MKTTLRRSALSLAALAIFIATPTINPAFAVPVETDTISMPVGSRPTGLAFSPNGLKAYVANYRIDSVSVISVEDGTVKNISLPTGSAPASVAVSPNGKQAYVGNYDNSTVSVIKTSSGTV